MNNSDAIKIYCARIWKDGALPLEIREWSSLSAVLLEKNVQPYELLEFSQSDIVGRLGLSGQLAERLLRLSDRSGKLFEELEIYENGGVYAITVADAEYPDKLKKTLGKSSPPVLYCAGDISFVKGKFAGFVGSRKADEKDELFTRETVRKTAACGYGVVSGGATGVDTFSESEAQRLGAGVIEFPSEGLLKHMRSGRIYRAVQDKSILLLSATLPLAPFSSPYALQRNRYIYAQSFGTVVVRSDYKKGGTWSGATDNLKHGFCTEFCWNNAEYAGNTALIARGAIPINGDFDGELLKYTPAHMPEQTSLF